MRTLRSYLLGILGVSGLALSNNALAGWVTDFTQPTTCTIPQSTSTHTCTVNFYWSQFSEPEPEVGTAVPVDYDLRVNSQLVGSGTSGNFSVPLNPGQNTYDLVGHESGSLYVKYQQYNEYSNSSSTHNTVFGDFNGDGIADRFLQAKSETGNNSLMPVALDEYLNPLYHREWTTTHPNVTAIEDWSEKSYAAFVGNFNSSPGDEVVLLGNKDIILLHGDIITPISVFPAVNNAIVSWNSSGTASYSEFSFDANPADYVVHVGNLDSDSYDEIFLQAAKKGGTSYILDSNGSLIQTIASGYLNAEWSAQSYAVSISNKTLVMTGLSSGNDNNVAYVNTSGAINVLQTPITQVNLQNLIYKKFAFEGVEYRVEPNVASSSASFTYSASGLPSWLSINNSNGLIYGTPTSADVNKSHSVTLTAKENKSHSIASSKTFSFRVEEAFSITNQDYNVYQASDGTLYLVSTSGSDVYKIVDDNGVRQIIKSSTSELTSSGATIQSNYSVTFEDNNLDGLTDLVISGAPGAGLDSWMISNVSGSYHDVVIVNQPIRRDLNHGPITLPEAVSNPLDGDDFDPTVVGSIPAEFSVNPSGSATYNVPLMVAPGSGGLVPQMSLAYDSHGGNGYLGVGWSIQGLSLIHHCQKNREQDGVVVPGKFDDFKYCLNGKKLYWDESSQRYSTEDKTSLYIERSGNQFVNHHLDGSRTIYSRVGFSKYLIYRKVDAAGNYIEFEYEYLTEQDPRLVKVLYTGNENNNTTPFNALVFKYDENREDEIYKRGSYESLNQLSRLSQVVSMVDIEANGDGGDELRTYTLNYEYATATGRSLLKDIKVCRSSFCLPKTTFDWQEGDIAFDTVNVYSNGSAYNNGKYGNTWGYQYLDFDGDGITDYWKNKNETGSSSDDLIIIKGGHPMTQLEVRNNYLNSFFRLSTTIIDYDNDGKDEVMYKDFFNWHIINAKQVSATRFHDFDNPINTQMPAYSNQVGSIENHKMYPADHNGDGYPDIVYIHEDKIWLRYNLNVDLDNPNGQPLFSDPVELPLINLTDPSGLPINGLPFPVDEDQDQRDAREEKLAYFLLKFEKFFRPIDFDGDGIVEYVIYKPQYISDSIDGLISSGEWVLFKKRTHNNSDKISSFNDFVYVSHMSSLNDLDNDDLEFVDLNQDGRLDAFSVNRSATEISISHALRSGNSLPSSYMESPWPNQTRTNNFFSSLTDSDYLLNDYFKRIREKANYTFIDYNSDGYLDLVHESEFDSNTYIRYFDGVSFTDSAQLPVNANNLKERNWIDVNGDGLLDYTYFEGRLYYQLSLGGKRDLITTITDGSDNKRIIEYATDVHTPDDDAKFKDWGNGSQVIDVGGPIYLVESTRKMSGDLSYCWSTSCHEWMDFEYTGLKAQVDRGMLGYRKFKVTDYVQNRVIENEYRQDFPHTGKLVSRTTTHGDSSDQFKETVDVTYALNSIGRSYVEETFTETWDKNISIKTQVVTNSDIDDFGRPGKVVSTIIDSSTNDEFKTTEEITYGFTEFYGGRPSKKVTKYDRTDETQIKQVSSFDYFSTTGLLKSKTIDPTADQGTSGANELEQNYGLTETYVRDDFGNVTSTTISGDDGIQRYAEVEYDLLGRYAEKQKAYPNYPNLDDVIETSTSYHSIFGVKESETSANGQVTRMGYSALGRLNFTNAANGTTVTTKQTFCSVAGDCPSRAFFKEEITSSHGPDSVIYFDDMGRKVLEKSEMLACHNTTYLANVCSETGEVKWVNKFYAYNNKGFKTIESRPYFDGDLPEVTNYHSLVQVEGYATFESDSRGRPITEYRADRSKWTTSYNGLTSSITNPASNITTKKVNVVGELVEMTDADNKTVEYAYDALGSLRLVRRAHSTISGGSGYIDTVIESDHLGRKVSMSDPDKGTVEYRYNSLGEMTWQKDNKGQVSEFDFDGMGRQIESRAYTDYGNLVLDHHTRTFYDSSVNGIGLVSEEEDLLNGVIQTYSYNVMSQVTRTKTAYSNGREFYTDVVYDDLFRVKETYDASHQRAGIAYEYYDNYLVKKTDLQSGIKLWKFLEADALGNTRIFENGNGVVNYQQHDQNDGSLEYIMALRNNTTDIQHNLYNFDVLGNLEYRDDVVVGMRESFNYDSLNRVDDWRVEYTVSMMTQTQDFDVNYDHLGNISDKTGMGSYTYGELKCGTQAGPHAVTSAGSNSYCYDANGNMISGGGRNSIVYNTNDKPTLIQTSKSHQIQYLYGLGGSRFKRIDTAADGTIKETLYVGNVEYISENGSLTKVLRHMEGIALETFIPQSGSRKLEFLHRDHLGSVELITDITGNTVSKFSYDPWGNRRDDTTYVSNSFGAIDSSLSMAVEDFRRGYTGHEHIDEAGLIHMGGRVFDPRLARFLSADPFVKTTENLQSFNRYTYVSNNPLNRTDPSGYFEQSMQFDNTSAGNNYSAYQPIGFDHQNISQSLLQIHFGGNALNPQQEMNWAAWDNNGNPAVIPSIESNEHQLKWWQGVPVLDPFYTSVGNVAGLIRYSIPFTDFKRTNIFTGEYIEEGAKNAAGQEIAIFIASFGQGSWAKRIGDIVPDAPLQGFVSGDPGALRDIVRRANAGNTSAKGELEIIKELREQGYNVHVINDKLQFRVDQGRTHEFFFGGPRPQSPESATGIAGEVKTLIGNPLKPNAVYNHADKAAHKQLQPFGGVLFFNVKHTITSKKQINDLQKTLKTGDDIDRALPSNVSVVFVE